MIKTKLTPEAINNIIYKFMGHCVHEWKSLTTKKYPNSVGYICNKCDRTQGKRTNDISDYYNSLDLLRPAEMKLDNEKFVQYVGLVINSQYGEVRFDDVCSALMAPFSIRATALAQIIGGME